jgi:tetratricopeptide (TPR) repeat protein
MATVYLAHDLQHDRFVALKVLRPELSHTLGPARFLREISLTARLDHPGILPLLDSGSADGVLYYTMPYVEGESLRARLDREKLLPIEVALRITREVGDALHHAHAHGIVHRDIKPENILLSGKHARVADFGVARAAAVAGGETLTVTGIAIGTIVYMSPEQAAGDSDVDGRSDVYSLASVLYEMLAGERPFSAPSSQALLARKSLETPRPLRTVRPAVPEMVERAVLLALAPMAADRFETAGEFVDALEGAWTKRDVPVVDRSRRASRMIVTAVAAAAVAAAVWSARAPATAPVREVLPKRIAVFPFAADHPSLADLREGLMYIVSSELDGAGEIRRVDPVVLMNRLHDEDDPDEIDLGAASRIARELGAGRFLLGRIVSVGQGVQIMASLYAGVNPDEPERQFFQKGSLDSTAALISEIARGVLVHLNDGPGTWASAASGALTVNVEAVLEYSRGENLMRQSRQSKAAEAFRKALEADSTFAIAWLRLALAEDYSLNDSSMVAAVDRAVQYSEGLSVRDGMLAEAMHANYHGDAARAERATLSLVSAYPGYGEGWYQRAATQFVYSWQNGRSPLEAKGALTEALKVDPDHRQSLHLLGWLAAHEGDYVRAESLQIRAWGHRWGLPPPNRDSFPSFMKGSESWTVSRVAQLVYATASRTDRLEEASAIAVVLTNPERHPAEVRSLGHHLGGLLRAAGGRWADAYDMFGRADSIGAGVGVLERGWIAALPFMRVDTQVRRSLRDSLATWTIPRAYLDRPRSRKDGRFVFMGLLAIPPWLVPHARHYVLGLLSASLGEQAEVTHYAGLLQRASEPADTLGLLGDLAREVRALYLMQRGDTAAALKILESASLVVASRYQIYESSFHTRPLTRLLRAEALVAAGREDEALGWYSALPWLDPAFVLVAWTSLRQGEINDRMGNRTAAEHFYRRFVTRWQDADAIHQPLVLDVRRRLAHLGEPTRTSVR